jgi:hypothetical protein
LEHRQSQIALLRAHETLENRVKKLTTDLLKANEALQRQVEERTMTEEALQHNYDLQAVVNDLLCLSLKTSTWVNSWIVPLIFCFLLNGFPIPWLVFFLLKMNLRC